MSNLNRTLHISEKTTNLQENINDALIKSMREGNATGLTGMPKRQAHENDSIPKIAPKWLKHDRQVSPRLSTPSPLCSQAAPSALACARRLNNYTPRVASNYICNRH